MAQTSQQAGGREPENGDRIRIQQGSRSIPELVGRLGTIVELFRVPHDSCLVRLDGDTDLLRTWFFYRDEFVASDA